MGKPNRKKRRGEDYCVMGIFIRGFFSLQLFHAPKSFRGRTPISINWRRSASDTVDLRKATKGQGIREASLYGSPSVVFLFGAIVGMVSSATESGGGWSWGFWTQEWRRHWEWRNRKINPWVEGTVRALIFLSLDDVKHNASLHQWMLSWVGKLVVHRRFNHSLTWHVYSGLDFVCGIFGHDSIRSMKDQSTTVYTQIME